MRQIYRCSMELTSTVLQCLWTCHLPSRNEKGEAWIFLKKKHYFLVVNLKKVTATSSHPSWVVVPEMVHHLSVLPSYPEYRSFDFCETLRSKWWRAASPKVLGELLSSWSSRAPFVGFGQVTNASFLCRISRRSPQVSHNPEVTSTLVKTIILQNFF